MPGWCCFLHSTLGNAYTLSCDVSKAVHEFHHLLAHIPSCICLKRTSFLTRVRLVCSALAAGHTLCWQPEQRPNLQLQTQPRQPLLQARPAAAPPRSRPGAGIRPSACPEPGTEAPLPIYSCRQKRPGARPLPGSHGASGSFWLPSRRPSHDLLQEQLLHLRCLHQKRSVHRAARALQDIKPADARDPGVRASLHAAQPLTAPAAPFESAELALQLAAAESGATAGGGGYWVCPPSWGGCRAIGLDGDDLRSLPIIRRRPRHHPRAHQSHPVRGASAGGLPAGRPLDRAREARGRRAAHHDQRDVVSLCRGLRAADERAGHRRTIGPAAGGGRHTRRHGDCGACACVSAS